MKNSLFIDEKKISHSEQLRVATLNLLHSGYKVKERFQMLNDEINRINPDILHLQEASFEHHNPYLQDFIKYHGYEYYHSSNRETTKNGEYSYTLTLSKFPASFELLHPVDKNNDGSLSRESVVMHTKFNGVDVITFNIHLTWGAKEHVRLSEVMRINSLAEEYKSKYPEAIIVIAGDFNTEENSDSMRFLRGEAAFNNQSTRWIDPWRMLGSESNKITSEVIGELAYQTAEQVNIVLPSLVPARRIDYIMVYGWAYGSNGSPLTFNRFADSYVEGLTISDHYGLYVDLLALN